MEMNQQVRVYDFRRPDKFSKNQLRTVRIIHENLSRLLTTSFSTLCRTTVPVKLMTVEQVPYGRFADRLDNPSILGIISVEPPGGSALIHVEHQIAFAMIDRLFGGPGAGIREARALTDIEISVMRRLFDHWLEDLEEAWSAVAEFRTRLEAIESNPLFAQLVAPNEITLLVTFEVSMAERSGLFQLCLPYLLLEPVVPQLNAHQWFSRTGPRDDQQGDQAMAEALRDVELTLKVDLGQTKVTIADLLEWETGQVVKLKQRVKDPLLVCVDKQPRFRGRAGLVGQNMAVEIQEKLQEGEQPDA